MLSREERFRLRLEEGYVSGSVSRRRDDLQRGLSETDLIEGIHVGVDRGHGPDLHSVDARSHLTGIDQEGILAREDERYAVLPAQVLDSQCVVEMAVCIDGSDGFQLVLCDEPVQRGILFGVAVAGIDDDTLLGVVPDHIGILTDGVEGQTGDFHTEMRCVFFIKVQI